MASPVGQRPQPVPPVILLPAVSPSPAVDDSPGSGQLPHPVELQADIIEQGPETVLIRWDPLVSASHYRLYQNDTLKVERQTLVVYRFEGLQPQTPYVFRLEAYQDTKRLAHQEIHLTTPAKYSGGGSGGSHSAPAILPSPTATPLPVLNTLQIRALEQQVLLTQTPALQSDPQRLFIALSPNILQALDAQGELIWAAALQGPPQTSPLLTPQGQIAVGTETGYLQLFDADGQQLWAVRLGDLPLHGLAYSEDLNLIYASEAGGRLLALDVADGQLRWEQQFNGPLLNGLAVHHDNTIILAVSRDTWAALDGETGFRKWTLPVSGSQIGGVSAALGFESSYLGYASGGLYAVNGLGQIRWVFADMPGMVGAPVVDDWGQVYFVGSDAWVYALDATGSLMWRYDLKDSPGPGTLTLDTAGHLYVPGGSRLHVLNQAGQPVVQPYSLQDSRPAGATLDAQGRVYILDQLGRLRIIQGLAPLAAWLWPKALGHAGNSAQQKRWEE